jgi:hypothetical protein
LGMIFFLVVLGCSHIPCFVWFSLKPSHHVWIIFPSAACDETGGHASEVQVAEQKVKKVLLGATSFLVVFNALAVPRTSESTLSVGYPLVNQQFAMENHHF